MQVHSNKLRGNTFSGSHVGTHGQLKVFYTCGHKVHVTAHLYLRLMDVTINVGNYLSIAAVFLDIVKSFDTNWYPGLVYKLLKFYISVSTVKLG
jgi:hypothetical protein